MNRKRVIFVKDISNKDAENYSKNYNNVIFFTNNENNQQIWFNGKKCSGISRIHDTNNILIYNYQYSFIGRTNKRDMYFDNSRIIIDYNSDIASITNIDIVDNNRIGYINAALITDNPLKVNTVNWSIKNDNKQIFSIESIDKFRQTISYDISKITANITPYKITLHAIINNKYDTYIDIFICTGEIVPFDDSISFNKFQVEKTTLSVDESISLKPVLSYTSIVCGNILPSIEISDIEWQVSDETICKISPEGTLTGIYNPKLDIANKHSITITVTCNIKVKNHEQTLTNTIDITIFAKNYANAKISISPYVPFDPEKDIPDHVTEYNNNYNIGDITEEYSRDRI